jgi:hypothetical protein
MKIPLRSTCLSLCIGIAVAATLLPAPVSAVDVSESALKAAFLYNFGRFTEWPADELEPAASLDICVVDTPIADALEAMVTGKSVGSHAVMVKRVVLDRAVPDTGRHGGLRACEMLYLGRLDLKAAQAVLVRLTEDAVLTVSDLPGFTKMGGVARFYVEGANVKFEINVASARRARLDMSAKLLQLAKIVKDE